MAYSQGSLYVTVGKGCSSLGSDCTEGNSRVCDGGCDLGICMTIEEGYYLDEAVVNRPKKRKRVGSSQVAANSVRVSGIMLVLVLVLALILPLPRPIPHSSLLSLFHSE